MVIDILNLVEIAVYNLIKSYGHKLQKSAHINTCENLPYNFIGLTDH